MQTVTQEWIAYTIRCWQNEPETAAELIWKKLQEDFEYLEERSEELARLEAAGVDNWEGY